MLKRRSFVVAAMMLALSSQAKPGEISKLKMDGRTRSAILAAMRRATQFMRTKVAVNGGYVWSYLPDLSRRWGEMEAYPTQIWTQAPGTPEMGQLFLDAYEATSDRYYYEAACDAADALIAGQHESGGWNYLIDFAGEDSLKRWYATIGKNGWRLEEFQHYYGNATFDDHATIECGRLMSRLYHVKKERKYRDSFDKALGFVLNSQFENGGWPQRWPPADKFNKNGRPDYTGLITLNDEVDKENIEFLLLAYEFHGYKQVKVPVIRAMDLLVQLQQPSPTPGWALQYTPDLKPAGARSYEPVSITPHGTATVIKQLIDFFYLTGDQKYIAGIEKALKWLEAIELPRSQWSKDGRNFYRDYDPATGTPMAIHRSGTNVRNGRYWADFDVTALRPAKRIDVASLRKRYDRAVGEDVRVLERNSIWNRPRPSGNLVNPNKGFHGSDLNATDGGKGSRIDAILAGLNSVGYWPSKLQSTSNVYVGDPPSDHYDADAPSQQVGDKWDTSPYSIEDGPLCISTSRYIDNMSILINALRKAS